MTLKRWSLTSQLLSAILLTLSGLSAVLSGHTEDVAYTRLTKNVGADLRSERGKNLKPLFTETIHVLEPSVKSAAARAERREENVSARELADWGTGSAEEDYSLQRKVKHKSAQTGEEKRGWEGIYFNGKKRAGKQAFLSKKGWEGMPFNGKRGWEGINFNGKRESLSAESPQESKRGWEGIYGGKKRLVSRGQNQFMKEIRRYSASTEGMGKLTPGKNSWEGLPLGKRGWAELTEGKRGWEGVLGKRGWEGIFSGKRGWEGITGKRGWEGVVGKRGWEGVFGKRGWEGLFGGKRGWEGLFGGKRGWEGVHNNCSCCQGERFRSCCSSCGRASSREEKRVDVIRNIVCACCDRVEVPSCCEVCQAMSQSY